MKYAAIFILTLAFNLNSYSQVYEPTWESLDQRETPEWFEDAKFGIFIHWGLYSVPAYTNKGTYAEWYWHSLVADPSQFNEKRLKRHLVTTEFHNDNYGEDFEYPDFRKMFKAEFFDPIEWANIFKRSGAKYVVLTSKHHDGFCLWPNKEASESFGMKWNSMEIGPEKDLLGELTTAVREQDLKMGLYYSIWDWFNPLWTEKQQMMLTKGKMVDNSADMPTLVKAPEKLVKESEAGLNRYIREVMNPQFKELVMNYEPSLIFSDGDWWMDDDMWQTKPLLAWLYNNAPNKDEVVINDRWGKVRGMHGGYFTTEYGSGFDNADKPWEENRGMGMSFGYNRIENIDDYRTKKELIFMLVDLVSRGGNLLLNIGPTADGRIPVIMQERLLQIGKWLDVNGEAIYGTRAWRKTAQWSEGNIPTFTKNDYHSGFPVYEMTINPKKGNAVKEFYFTQKGSTLYAFSPKWPDSNKIFIKDVNVGSKTIVTLLGNHMKLPFKAINGGVEIDISSFGVNDVAVNHMHVFKLTEVK